MPDLIDWAAKSHGERPFLVLGERKVSFADAERQSAEIAKGLLALGVGKGTKVGLLMENAPDWPLCFFGAARAGAVTVGLSTFYQAPEIAWALRHNDIDTLIVSARYLEIEYLDRLELALPGLAEHAGPQLYIPSHPFLRRIIVWGDCDRPWALRGPGDVIAAGGAAPAINAAFLDAVRENIVPADDLMIICTSGSTAEPKAVLHTHGVCVRSTYEFQQYTNPYPQEKSYCGMPFFWIAGISMNLLPTMYVGGTLYFAKTPAPADVIDVIETERVTRVHMWPAQVQGLRDNAAGRDLSSLRTGYFEPNDLLGNPIPPERRMAGLLGMTESFSLHAVERRDLPTPLGKGGHWGRVVRGMELCVVDPETREVLGSDEKGELYIRGYNLLRGYYKKEREETFTRDGWFETGDLASIDEDGFVYFFGRLGDMIKTAGANVAPREIELKLQTFPGVREAIVFGLPDATKEEAVAAVVVPKGKAVLATEDLRAFLKEQVSAFKVPRTILFMDYDDIPRTGSNKPVKSLVRAAVMARLDAEEGSAK
jgi:acyl-CoA synthetase (AMP-forming)/AMP-acid ligase II